MFIEQRKKMDASRQLQTFNNVIPVWRETLTLCSGDNESLYVCPIAGSNEPR
jgi:hypothetical protein